MAHERGLHCHAARGGELERDYAFGVVRQLLEAPLAALAPAEREALLTGAAALARPVLAPDPGQSAEPGESAFAVPHSTGFVVLHGLYWVCAALAEILLHPEV